MCCRGSCRHSIDEECANATEFVVPYRGVYARHLGRDQAIAEANQVLFFNAAKGYRVSHPVPEGDACLSLTISEPLLRDLPFRASLSEKVVRVAGVEPALLSELDFEGSRVYKKRCRCCSPVLQQIPISVIHAPVPHLVQRKRHRPMCTL